MNLASDTYLLWKSGSTIKTRPKKKKTNYDKSSRNDRDPVEISNVLTQISSDWGWSSELQVAAVIANWNSIVGEKIGSRTAVQGVSGKTLIVECVSTAWATELRRIRVEIITKIQTQYPDADINDLKFVVSGIPSWQHGRMSVRGKGPRDTYK